MAYGNNDNEYEAGAPKKADVLIRSTQHIALRQDELSEQTTKMAARLEEAIELFSKNDQDSSYIVKQSGEIFTRLQSENSALKQELLYLAKQSENIYAGLAEKITELSDHAKTRDESFGGLTEKINNVAEQTKKSEEVYATIMDRLAEFAEQNKRNEQLLNSLSEKLDAVNARSLRTEVVGERAPVEVDNSAVLEKLNYVSEQLRRNEGAHSMLADKFEILSMRVEQFGYESAKGQPAGYRQTAMAYPVPSQPADIDYDKLAEKVASLISAREVISPDYIASKVAEQIVVPEVDAKNVHISVDTHEMAKEVAELVNGSVKTETVAAPVTTNVNIDEEGLAEAIAHRLADMRNGEIAPASAVLDFDEEALAEKIASKIGSVRVEGGEPANAVVNIDQDELADSIALKVGSLKAEDFEILVDDDGCNSISKNIADSLNYEVISNIIADKLQEALDLAAVNAPDYEEMAERISEKITVAGINEDAIADKAAAALSNYLPEFDTDEITDKITGAVIDVVSAMPQPTVDNETICNNISQRLIESQEDHDYDIVIDDDGISKITELVSEEIEEKTGARFDKVEENIAKLCELIESKEQAVAVIEEPVANTETVEEVAEPAAVEEKAVAEIKEEDYDKLSSLMASEIEKGTASRFDKVEEDIAKLTELLSSVATYEDEGDYEEYDEQEVQDESYEQDDYSVLSEVVAAEIQKGVASRLDSVEENLAKLTEYFAEEDVQSDEVEDEEKYEEKYEEVEEDYSAISEIVAAEIQKGVSTRLDGLEENIARITEYITTEETKPVEVAEVVEEVQDYTALSEAVVAELEKGISPRLDGLEENIARITEYITTEETQPVEVAEVVEEVQDYTALSEAVVAELEKGISPRLDGLEENLAKLTEYFAEEDVQSDEGEYEENYEEGEDDYSAISEIVAAEIQKGVSTRLDGLEENIARITEYITTEETQPVEDVEVVEEVQDYTALSEAVVAELEREISARFDSVDENIAKITEYIAAESEKAEEAESEVSETDDSQIIRYDALPLLVAAEVERGLSARLDSVQEDIAKITEYITAESEVSETDDSQVIRYDALPLLVAAEVERGLSARLNSVDENIAKITDYITAEETRAEEQNPEASADGFEEVKDYSALSEVVAAEIERGISYRLDSVEENIAKLTEIVSGGLTVEESDGDEVEEIELDYSALSEAFAAELEKGLSARLDSVDENIVKLTDIVAGNADNKVVAEAVGEDYSRLSEVVAAEIERGMGNRFDKVEDDIAKLSERVSDTTQTNARFDKIEEDIAKISGLVESGVESKEDSRLDKLEEQVAKITEIVEGGTADKDDNNDDRFDKLEEGIAKISELFEGKDDGKDDERLDKIQEDIAKISDYVEGSDNKDDERFDKVQDDVAQIKQMISEGVIVAGVAAAEAAPADAASVKQPAYEEFEEDEEEEDDEDFDEDDEDGVKVRKERDGGFMLDVFDMDEFSDNELMPGELSDFGGVDFANMMKFKRSFIARIIMSNDEYKQYYGEVKHALISYKKVNSNVAWSNERFNKGRETIARLKIRGKTLCLYLALDPNNYKTSVYHHLDVSDNKSVEGTPMMVKVKSPLGVRKAIRLIDEMLAMRGGEKKEIPERDYAAMYPYETIEELIEDGLVKDVRKK